MFLSQILPLDKPQEWLQFMLLKEGDVRYINFPSTADAIDDALLFAKKANADGWNVHFRTSTMSQCPEKRGTEVISSRIAALWVDIDSNEDIYYNTLLGARPSIIVKTGGGYHGYWRLNKPISIAEFGLEKIKYTLRGLAMELSGDIAPANLSACLRLPGCVNRKPNRGNLVEIVHQSEILYTMESMAYYTDMGTPPRRDWHALKARTNTKLPQWVQDFISGHTPEGKRNRTAFSAGMWLIDHGIEGAEELIFNGGLACGLKEREIRSVIGSIFRRASRKV